MKGRPSCHQITRFNIYFQYIIPNKVCNWGEYSSFIVSSTFRPIFQFFFALTVFWLLLYQMLHRISFVSFSSLWLIWTFWWWKSICSHRAVNEQRIPSPPQLQLSCMWFFWTDTPFSAGHASWIRSIVVLPNPLPCKHHAYSGYQMFHIVSCCIHIVLILTAAKNYEIDNSLKTYL